MMVEYLVVSMESYWVGWKGFQWDWMLVEYSEQCLAALRAAGTVLSTDSMLVGKMVE